MAVNVLRVHHYEPLSQSNGPGTRFTLWLQGCTLGCPGCFNPLSHPAQGGKVWSIDKIISLTLPYREQIDGFTISGGEPLQQLHNLSHLLRQLKSTHQKSIILFSGYEWSEIQAFPGRDEILAYIDVLIAGRYQAYQRIAQGLTGSANKTFHFFSSALNKNDFTGVPSSEVFLDEEGNLRITGIDPPGW
jgi:anaerobic ribonucleoside-triphosphate reductase activating protein